MTVIFNDTLGVFGGSQTLMLRMAIWLRTHNISVCIICDSDANEEIVTELRKLDVRIEVCKPEAFNVIANILKEYTDFLVINFGFGRYLNVECIKKKYNIQFDNIIYDIIPITFLKGSGFKSNFLRNHAKRKYLKILLRMVKNGAVISQEETNNKSVCSYFGIKFSDYNPKILRIPMVCNPLENCELIIKDGYSSSIILTAARADFPFKGYMIGLVDEFVKIKESVKNAKLKIYSDGGDIEVLREKINSVSTGIQKDIELCGWISYTELYSELKKCKMYIGLGSSLMDAALNYKPSIVASYNTTKCVTAGTFADNPYCIGTKEEDLPASSILIDKIFNMSFEEYREMCHKNFNAVYDNYNIDKIMSELINSKTTNQNCILTLSERLENYFNIVLNRIRFRNKTDKNRYVI